jgi:uncharacterized protein YeaO (DUF488 family)
MIRLRRAYEEPSPEDGYRILVERLWPRGRKKTDVALDLWLKEIAPSPELRRWFGHDPDKWEEFCRRYGQELEANPEAVQILRDQLRKHATVTLVYGSKDEEHNAAVALKSFLENL